MEQTPSLLAPPQPAEMTSAHDPSSEPRAPQTPGTQHHPNLLTSPQTPETKSPKPTIKSKNLSGRADWVNTMWVDISGQLRRLAVISESIFDGLLLRRDTLPGSEIFAMLQQKYRDLGDDRNLATVTVASPETVTGEVEEWRLLWNIKRHRDPNGRQFHSETPITNAANHQNHLELDPIVGQLHSSDQFLLPLFIQDYGPGPSEFDPEPESEFDRVMREIMDEAGLGRRVDG